MIRLSVSHLEGAEESYFEHMAFAATVGAMTIAAGLACVVHSLLPAVCQRTASLTIVLLTELFQDRSRLGEIRDRSMEAILFATLFLFAAAALMFLLIVRAPVPLTIAYGALAFAMPFALLASNPELDLLEATH